MHLYLQFSTESILHMYIIAQTYLRFCKNKRNPYVHKSRILLPVSIFLNLTTGGVVITSLKFSRWRPMTSWINFRFHFGSARLLRWLRSPSVPNFVKISQATAKLQLLPVLENERSPYWISNSGSILTVHHYMHLILHRHTKFCVNQTIDSVVITSVK